MSQLRQYGEVRRSTIGIELANDLSLSDSAGTGDVASVKVKRVQSGSPAEAAGILAGDAVVAVGDIRVRDAHQLRETIQKQAVGSRHRLSVERDGVPRTVEVTTELWARSTPPAGAAYERSQPTEVIYSRELQLEVSSQQPASTSSAEEAAGAGVLVLSVDRAGPAYRAGVRVGMSLISIDGHDVHDIDSCADAMELASLAQGMKLVLQTENGRRQIDVQEN